MHDKRLSSLFTCLVEKVTAIVGDNGIDGALGLHEVAARNLTIQEVRRRLS